MAASLFINGKFSAQRRTGVQRVAHNLIAALDAHLASGERGWVGRTILLVPPGAQVPDLACIETRVVGTRGLPLHIWEQFQLPIAARQGLLLNLAGSAPLLARRQVCLVHDAAVFDAPQAYTVAFRGWYQVLFRLLAWREVPLLTVSDFSRQRLAERLHLPPASIGVLPNGGEHLQAVPPDLAALGHHGLTPGRYLLAVGSDNPNKNLAALHSAFRQLPAGLGAKLVVVGSSDPRIFATRPTSKTHVPAPGIVRIGCLDDAGLKSLYQHAAGLIFPSLYEGFGLPPLEAMSCGCPVAASNAAAIPEVCGDAAMYFDPNSVEQLAHAMQSLLEDAALRDRLRSAGRHQVRRFTWPRAAEALLAQLHPRLASTSPAPSLAMAAAKPGHP